MLLLLPPVRFLIQEGVWRLGALGSADATVVPRRFISRQGSCLISMATQEVCTRHQSCQHIHFVPHLINVILIVVQSTWECRVRQVEGGCRGPEGRSFWWVCLRAWLNHCLDFWLTVQNKCMYVKETSLLFVSFPFLCTSESHF